MIPKGVINSVNAIRTIGSDSLNRFSSNVKRDINDIQNNPQSFKMRGNKFINTIDPIAIAGMTGSVASVGSNMTNMVSPMIGFEDGKAITDKTGRVVSRYLIRPIKDLVAHEKVDPIRVNKYIEHITSGRDIEPLKIIREGIKYGVEDGKHRLAAMKALGYTDAPVELLRSR